jgi:hypothetical protein
MPTVLLLDVSASLSGSISSSDESITRQEALQSGVLHFLKGLQTSHPHEQVCIAGVGSTAEMLVPFTTDNQKLVQGLYDLTVDESTSRPDLTAGMGLLAELRASTRGEALQVLFVGEGVFECSVNPMHVKLHGHTRIHAIAIGSQKSDAIEPLHSLVQRHDGSLIRVDFPAEVKLVKDAVDRLAQQYFSTWSGTLVLGQLSVAVRLSPDPSIHLGTMHHPTRLETLQLTSELCIVGFVSNMALRCPPIISRHAVALSDSFVPPPPKRLELACAIPKSYFSAAVASSRSESPVVHKDGSKGLDHAALGTPPIAKPALTGISASPTDSIDGQQPSWVDLLAAELTEQHASAVIELGEGWFGYLSVTVDGYSVSGGSTDGVLVLSVLAPPLPSRHSKASSKRGSSSIDEQGASMVTLPLPAISDQTARSYSKRAKGHSHSTLTLQSEQLKAEFQRLQRQLRMSPLNRATIKGACERIRKASLVNMAPTLTKCLEETIEFELELQELLSTGVSSEHEEAIATIKALLASLGSGEPIDSIADGEAERSKSGLRSILN